MARKNNKTIYREWVKTVTAGEFLGFLVPTVAGVMSVALEFSQLAQMVTLVLAGLGEGALLGYFQSRVLAKYIKGFKRVAWVKATVAGAGLAWAIGMFPSTVGDKLSSVPVWLLIPFGIILGCILLLSIGYTQYLVFKKYIKNAYKWIWVNVVAWVGGLAAVFAIMFTAPEGTFNTIVFSALGGLAMAFTMSVITGMYATKATTQKTL